VNLIVIFYGTFLIRYFFPYPIKNNDFLSMKKNVKQDIFKNKFFLKTKLKSNFYTWIRIRIQQLKLMCIRNPVIDGKRSCITVSHGIFVMEPG
jgi:hypothetical protein